ncbi:hypothetical protein ACWEGQ_10720 [Streptomyces seoulensis]
MYRHHIAPARGFTQFSNDLLRHPRLSSDAIRLLTWQQLKEEGYVHERRVQGPGGLWVTQQLVSNVPLSAAEAAKLLGREPIGPAGPSDVVRTVRAAPVPACADSASPQLAPSPRKPAAGAPTPRPADGHPEKDPEGNTSHRPAEPRPEAEGLVAGARVLVAAFPQLSPDLRRVPRAMHGELVRLTIRWLAAGHTAGDIRTHILRGLPDDGTTVHRPGGLLRYLLREVPPVVPAAHRPRLHRPPAARLAGLRECEGDHVQATLFRPLGDETRCSRCLGRGRSTDARDTSPRPSLPVTFSSG